MNNDDDDDNDNDNYDDCRLPFWPVDGAEEYIKKRLGKRGKTHCKLWHAIQGELYVALNVSALSE